MNIENWLAAFTTYWTNKNIDGVMSLFTPDVDYWETPYKKLLTFDMVRAEWQAIHPQSNIIVKTKVFVSDSDKHAVLWDLIYTDQDGAVQYWAGVYLIQLNAQGQCSYFQQVGEPNAPLMQ